MDLEQCQQNGSLKLLQDASILKANQIDSLEKLIEKTTPNPKVDSQKEPRKWIYSRTKNRAYYVNKRSKVRMNVQDAWLSYLKNTRIYELGKESEKFD